jgi:primase-polymerase (primpol)-like protein
VPQSSPTANSVTGGGVSTQPAALPVRFEELPINLPNGDRYVLWRYEFRHDKWTKVPYGARTGLNASSTDPNSWATFAEVEHVYRNVEPRGHFDGRFDGAGITLIGDGLVGIDCDHCYDSTRGTITQDWALDIVSRCHSYTEISPSGTGLRVLVFSDVTPAHNRRRLGAGVLEIYSDKRYLSLTGHHIAGTPTQVRPV